MKAATKALCFSVTFGLFGLFSLYMLAVPNYFAVDSLPDVVFGLFGVQIKGEASGYSTLQDDCGPTHVLADVCESLETLQTAGATLTAFLVADVVLTFSYVLNYVLARQFLSKLAQKSLEQGRVPTHCVFRLQLVLKYAIFAHPWLLLAGLVTWVVLCDFHSLPGAVEVEQGLALGLCYAFLSLLVLACYFYFIRRAEAQLKRERPPVDGRTYLKEDSIECSEIDLKV